MAGEFLQVLEEEILEDKFTGVTLYLGLATAPIINTDTLVEVAECQGAGYARQQINFGSPQTDNGVTVVKNTEELSFGPWEELEPNLITHGFITDAASGTVGRLLVAYTLDTSIQSQPMTSDVISVPVDSVVVGLE